MNTLSFIRNNLYILKRQYGNPIDLYTDNETIDLTTGIKTHTKTVYHINRAVILPMGLTAQAVFNQAYMKNIGREFAYGNVFSVDMKTIILDQRDIPSTFNLTPDDYVTIDEARFEILKVNKLEKNLGYEVVIKRSLGVPPGKIYDIIVQQSIRFIERQLCQ